MNKELDLLMGVYGQKGFEVVADTETYTTGYCKIYALTEIVLDTVVGNNISGQNGKTIPIGTSLYGDFSSIKLTSGTAILNLK